MADWINPDATDVDSVMGDDLIPDLSTVDVTSLVPDTGLCGASAGFDGLLSKLKTIESDLLANIDMDAN